MVLLPKGHAIAYPSKWGGSGDNYKDDKKGILMKGYVLAFYVLASSTIVFGAGFGAKNSQWINESDAKSESRKFQKCKICKGSGYISKTVKIGDPKYNLSSYFPKESKNNRKKIFIQCESCTTALEEERKRQLAEQKKEQNAKWEEYQKKEYERFSAISSSLIGVVDEIAPKQINHRQWALDYKGREKDKDYGWTPDDAKLMPARCPIVFQVINSKSFLVKSQVNDTFVIIDTIDDYEVSDNDPFLRWGTFRYVGTKSYTTIRGAKKTVPWIKQTK